MWNALTPAHVTLLLRDPGLNVCKWHHNLPRSGRLVRVCLSERTVLVWGHAWTYSQCAGHSCESPARSRCATGQSKEWRRVLLRRNCQWFEEILAIYHTGMCEIMQPVTKISTKGHFHLNTHSLTRLLAHSLTHSLTLITTHSLDHTYHIGHFIYTSLCPCLLTSNNQSTNQPIKSIQSIK